MNIKKDFPIFTSHPDLVYLDSGATSQKPQVVITAIEEYYKTYCSNIHRGLYPIAEKASEKIEETRTKTAAFINATAAEEIIFTKNTTEAINMVAYTFGEQQITKGDGVVVSITEHHANFVPWQQLCLRKQGKFQVIGIDKEGNLDMDDKIIDYKKTKILCLPYVSNVLGIINPIQEIIRTVRKKNKRIKILIDASQAVMHFPVDVQALDCDFFVFTGHKMFAGTGVGVLYARKELLNNMNPFLFGGDMIREVALAHTTFADVPSKFEAGTPPIASIISLGAAIAYIQTLGFEQIQEYEKKLTAYAIEQLQQIKHLRILGSQIAEERIGVISFVFDDIHPHDVAQILADENICVRAGHHCAMPLHTFFQIAASTRISLLSYNTPEDIDTLCATLKKIQTLFKK